MDIELLRTFLELNRSRHFGRSAEALHITQGAVSNRLKTLENMLGVTLFERTRRSMRLTSEGSRLIRHAERQLAGWRAARQDVALASASDQLVIGGSLRLWDVLLQQWMHSLRRHFPTVAIIAESQSPDVLTRRLIDGTLDVAIMLEPAQLDVLQVQEIATVELILVSTIPGQSCEQALGPGYVFVDWGLSFGLDHRRAYPDAPEALTRVSHAKMAMDYIIKLGGSAYLPKDMVSKDIEFGLLHRVKRAAKFTRTAWATFAVRSARLELINESLRYVRST